MIPNSQSVLRATASRFAFDVCLATFILSGLPHLSPSNFGFGNEEKGKLHVICLYLLLFLLLSPEHPTTIVPSGQEVLNILTLSNVKSYF